MYQLPQGTCNVRDTSGADGSFTLRMYPRPPGCLTDCAIAEHGQSGQPLWVENGAGDYTVRAVLSRGPMPGTCGGADTYTQLDLPHFKLLSSYLSWTPDQN